MYKKNPKLLNQFQYSEREGVPLLVIVGEEEKARGGVKIRDTHSRQEVSQLHCVYIIHVPPTLYDIVYTSYTVCTLYLTVCKIMIVHVANYITPLIRSPLFNGQDKYIILY